MITREALDRVATRGCQHPHCSHDNHREFFFHAACHPRGRIEVSYKYGSGVLVIACQECQTPIATIAVAKEAA